MQMHTWVRSLEAACVGYRGCRAIFLRIFYKKFDAKLVQHRWGVAFNSEFHLWKAPWAHISKQQKI